MGILLQNWKNFPNNYFSDYFCTNKATKAVIWQSSVKKAALEKFVNFIEKHLQWSALLLNY